MASIDFIPKSYDSPPPPQKVYSSGYCNCSCITLMWIFLQVWNEELALLAEGFAAKCVANHQTDRNPRSPSFESVGRNFYVLSDLDLENKVNFSTIIGVWFSESSDYNYNESICFGPSCGNYTQVCRQQKSIFIVHCQLMSNLFHQMVSASSNQLGCGSFYCEQPVLHIGIKGRFFVCNYAPG